MFLTSMELFGFKSFPDRTRIEFEQGTTVIVGPNGCGKSNIVDALKWVLGEKQARNIRGERMEDIIFSGTEQRKPLSLSEVSISIDNTERILDIDSDTVTVSRRVYRDGESEYLINKSPVRLKDIEKLFMDTGIGKSAYSVMEQGRMDLILSTRAEDRRYIFEEAAGISRYKLQKKESLQKLDETGSNLHRINDIIREIEREMEMKADQADKTTQYLALRSEQKEIDIKINYLKQRELAAKDEKIRNEIESLQKSREALATGIASVSAENEKDEKCKNDIQHDLFELEKKLHEFKIRAEDIDVKTEKNRLFIREQERRVEALKKNEGERKKSAERVSGEIQKAEEASMELRGRISSDRENLSNFRESRKRKAESIRKSRETMEADKKSILLKDENLKKLRAGLEVVIRELIDAIEKRKAEILVTEDERERIRGSLNRDLQKIDELLKRAISLLGDGKMLEAAGVLKAVDIASLTRDLHVFQGYDDGFRTILIDKSGIHAKKEEIDRQIQHELKETERLKADIAFHESKIQGEQAELEGIGEMTTKLEKDLSRNENEADWIGKHVSSLHDRRADLERQVEALAGDIASAGAATEDLRREILEWEKKLAEFDVRRKGLLGDITALNDRRAELDKKIHDRKHRSGKDEEDLKRLAERISALDRAAVEVAFRKNSIEEYLWVEYEKKIPDLKGLEARASDAAVLAEAAQELKGKIHELGPINNLAITEYQNLKIRFDYYLNQKKDIEKATHDILSVIDDINKTSVDIFTGTFNEIQKNFSEIFRQLFEGGEAYLELLDRDNVLECGIDIMVRPPGKKFKNINLLSGGERALTAIALLFATYMAKPSPFCFLDEIDAPLDEENIGRFTKMLKEFSRNTQFVIVTHNKKSMIIGDSIYGITMEEPGISKVLSLKMSDVEARAGIA